MYAKNLRGLEIRERCLYRISVHGLVLITKLEAEDGFAVGIDEKGEKIWVLMHNLWPAKAEDVERYVRLIKAAQ